MTAGARSIITPPPTNARVGIVVIGRNEGDRLLRCIDSIDRTLPVVYVDSGSDDGSPEHALRLGVDMVRLDEASPFTAARARNAGLDHLHATAPALDYVQMIDADCEMLPGWIDAAAAAMATDSAIGAVFGQLRERWADRSSYNWLCNVEWRVPPGKAETFGGNVLLRCAAIQAIGGYRDAMIAGEEPDLSVRMRRYGWEILCIDQEMMVHDAAIYRFGQWWRRTARGGHAFAQLADLHPNSRAPDYRGLCRRTLMWGAAIPLTGLAGFGYGIIAGHKAGFLLFGMSLLLPLLQIARLTVREQRRRPIGRALTLATFLTLGKYAEITGLIRFHADRLLGRQPRIIEYKRPGGR
jgi:glycosyltransferase involved in cell wall biosynthesis